MVASASTIFLLPSICNFGVGQLRDSSRKVRRLLFPGIGCIRRQKMIDLCQAGGGSEYFCEGFGVWVCHDQGGNGALQHP